MSIPETVLTFVGAPAAIVAAIFALVLGPGALKGQGRYRPGKDWPHEPAWYLPNRLVGPGGTTAEHKALPAGGTRDVSPAGGASGEW